MKSMLWQQLDSLSAEGLCGLRILDFGSGDGSTACHFASRNSVVAVEPSPEQLADRFTEHSYEQRAGSLDQLSSMPDGSFDLVFCHNVLEYIEHKQPVLTELLRVLRPGGMLSVVKHNRPGRVLQAAVLLDDFDRANSLLDGEDSSVSRFGRIRYYDDAELLAMCPGCRCISVFGMRAFWDLQQDQHLHSDPLWREKMLALENRVSALEPYRSIAFFHHLILQKA